MKQSITLIFCVAIAPLLFAEPNDNNSKKGKHQGQQQQGQSQQLVATPKGHGQHHGQANTMTSSNNLPAVQHKNKTVVNNTTINNTTINKTTFKGKHFKLSGNPNPSIQSAKFKANYHIPGSQKWKGQKYIVFQNYSPVWHDQAWWIGHHNHIIFVSGGWYYWNQGYYYPAWGYAPNAYFAYDGPIYVGSYETDPGQVVANVQSTLQEQGYYHGEVDGILGPQTRGALADYQQAQGLEPTGAVDEPTLESLGMA